jgi:hypothetical protein
VNYVIYDSYVIHASYIGHVYDNIAHVFYDVYDDAFGIYGSAVISPMSINYMEIKCDCQWLVMLSLRMIHLIGLYNDIIMECIRLEY